MLERSSPTPGPAIFERFSRRRTRSRRADEPPVDGQRRLVAMAASRDAREPRDGRAEYKARGSHETNHDRAPTSLPDGRRRPFDEVADASLGVRAGKPCPSRDDAQEMSPV